MTISKDELVSKVWDWVKKPINIALMLSVLNVMILFGFMLWLNGFECSENVDVYDLLGFGLTLVQMVIMAAGVVLAGLGFIGYGTMKEMINYKVDMKVEEIRTELDLKKVSKNTAFSAGDIPEIRNPEPENEQGANDE
ncbi:MAG: hypothetical protein H6860_05250 [Rhodospirillales bacterium]|nr:hypothetical protein [Rhodospirillales bacterium]